MIRIHLTAMDLLRTRVASDPAPLVEVGYALAAMRRRDPALSAWRRSAAARLPPAARPLLDLVPGSGSGPLFLDPISTSVAEGLEAVQRAPTPLVAAELRRVYGARRPPSWVRMLAERDPQSWRDLNQALLLIYRHLLAESWPQILSGFRSEVAWLSRLIGELGLQAALASLHPAITWNKTVLQIATPKELDFRPRGAGLTLMPALLWTGRPHVGTHPNGSTAVVYPALTPLPLIGSQPRDPLGALLGHTRAAVLRLTVSGCTTTELASELRVSPASISGHTKALRAAGLIVTDRNGKSVRHSATRLGDRLLETARSAPEPAGWNERFEPPRLG